MMYGEARKGRSLRAAIVVGAVTLLALAVPVGAPLYAEVYPPPPPPGPGDPPGPGIDKNALTEANVTSEFDPPLVTQFETTSLRATVIYGTSINPNLPRVEIAWSNEADLTAPDEGTFVIERTSTSRLNLGAGTRLSGGGLGLTWTWDVTPLVAGKHSLELHIVPTIIIDGKTVPDARSVNHPIPVSVDVHPVQQDFEEVLAAADTMETTVPATMTVGIGSPVSASLSLAGHTETVSADIELSAGKGSADVSIVEESASASAVANVTAANSDEDSVMRRWTVTPDEPGPVKLIFTAKVQGDVVAQTVDDGLLTEEVVRETSVQATPSIWQVLQQPVQYLTPFVAFAVAVLGLWAAWKSRKSKGSGESTGDGKATGTASAKKATAKKRKTAEKSANDKRTAVGLGDPAP